MLVGGRSSFRGLGWCAVVLAVGCGWGAQGKEARCHLGEVGERCPGSSSRHGCERRSDRFLQAFCIHVICVYDVLLYFILFYSILLYHNISIISYYRFIYVYVNICIHIYIFIIIIMIIIIMIIIIIKEFWALGF